MFGLYSSDKNYQNGAFSYVPVEEICNVGLPGENNACGKFASDKKNAQSKRRKIHLTTLGKIVFTLLGLISLAVVAFVFQTAYVWIEGLLPVDGTFEKFTEKAKNQIVNELSGKEARLDERMLASPENYNDIFLDSLSAVFDGYVQGQYSYDETLNILSSFEKFDFCDEKARVFIENTQKVKNGREALLKAEAEEKNQNYGAAARLYMQVPSEDKAGFAKAQKAANQSYNKILPELEYTFNGFLAKNSIDEAREYAENLIRLFGDKANSFKTALLEYEAFQNDLVEYRGPVEHVFTHCLIAFPELCYSSPSMTRALDTDCITPSEFSAILRNLYEKDYILIDINLVYDSETDGIAKLYLPKGKKPLVLSIDDVTYDSRKMHTGMVDRLMVDENGDICTYTLQNGKEIISYENEVFPIVNSFVREHPDFSFKGARGVLCLTGFDGVFGYRTQSEPLGNEKGFDREKEIGQAKIVAEALREEGWGFASHGFGHRRMSQISFELAANDTDKWQKEVVPVVGETKVMVWPYGDHVRKGEVHKYLYDTGFRIFCGVGTNPYLAKEPDGLGIFMDRKALDGYSLRNRRESYMYLFDTEEVWDKLRPKEITW